MKTTIGIIGATAVTFLVAGCETQSARQAVVVTPTTATLQRGQSITLTASGGYDYHWQLRYEGWGYLSSRTGATVTYTSRAAASEVAGSDTSSGPLAQQVITVVSMVTDSAELIDNFVSSDHTAASTDPNLPNYPSTSSSSSSDSGSSSSSSQPYQVRGTAVITHL